jgi:hypothetical protein
LQLRGADEAKRAAQQKSRALSGRDFSLMIIVREPCRRLDLPAAISAIPTIPAIPPVTAPRSGWLGRGGQHEARKTCNCGDLRRETCNRIAKDHSEDSQAANKEGAYGTHLAESPIEIMPPACGPKGSAIRTFRQLFEVFFKWSNVAIA